MTGVRPVDAAPRPAAARCRRARGLQRGPAPHPLRWIPRSGPAGPWPVRCLPRGGPLVRAARPRPARPAHRRLLPRPGHLPLGDQAPPRAPPRVVPPHGPHDAPGPAARRHRLPRHPGRARRAPEPRPRGARPARVGASRRVPRVPPGALCRATRASPSSRPSEAGRTCLHVGSSIPRKRLDVLFEVFAALRARATRSCGWCNKAVR